MRHDRGAAQLMHALLALGRAIPGDIRLAGVDDVELRRAVAGAADDDAGSRCGRLARLRSARCWIASSRRGLVARDILLDVELVVRESCGAASRC